MEKTYGELILTITVGLIAITSTVVIGQKIKKILKNANVAEEIVKKVGKLTYLLYVIVCIAFSFIFANI